MENFSHALASLAHVAGLQGLHPWNETRILNHEGHQLGRVAANIEKFQAVFLDELLKRPMCGQADAVAVCRFQYLPQSHEWLYVSSRSNDMYDDVEWRWYFGRPAIDIWRRVCWRWKGFGLFLQGGQLDLLNLLSKSGVCLVYMYVDAPII